MDYMPTAAARALVASLKELLQGAAARGVEAGAGFVVIPPEEPGDAGGIAIPFELAGTPSAEAESVLCRDIVPRERPLPTVTTGTTAGRGVTFPAPPRPSR